MQSGGRIANLSAHLEWDLDDFQRGTRTVSNAFNGLIGLAGKVGDAVAGLGKRMTIGLSAPLTAIATLTTKAASDAQELQSAFDYTFGAMSKRMNAWAKETGDAMGRATQEMQQGALAFGQLFKAAAPTEQAAARLAQQFTELAQDASSFYNVDFDTAMQKIRSGLTGEAEPLRDFGVFLNEAAVQAKGLEMGLVDTGEELNEYGKIMARQALIAEGLADAQDDVRRTAGGLENMIRTLRANIHELAVEIGEILIPYAQRLVGHLTNLVQWFKDLPEGVKRAAVVFGIFAAAAGPVLFIASQLAMMALPLLILRFASLGGVISPLLLGLSAIVSPFGTMVALAGKAAGSLGGLSAIVGRLVPMFARFLGPVGVAVTLLSLFGDDIARGLRAFADAIREAVGPRIQELFSRLGDLSNQLSDAFVALMETPLVQWLRDVAGTLMDLQVQWQAMLGTFVGEVIGGMIGALNGFVEFLQGFTVTVRQLMVGNWSSAWDQTVQVVGRACIRIGNFISTLFPVFGTLLKMLGAMTGAKLTVSVPDGNGITKAIANMREVAAANSKRSIDPGARDYAEASGGGDSTSASSALSREADELGRTLDRLFPEVARLREYRKDMAELMSAKLPAGYDRDEALQRLRWELADVDPDKKPDFDFGIKPLTGGLDKVGKAIKDLTEKAQDNTVRIAKSFKDMADETLWSLNRLTSSIKSGGFLDIVQSVVGLGLQLGSSGVFGSGIAKNLNKVAGSGLGSSSSIIGGLPGFAQGGSFQVAGAPGVDKNLLSLNGRAVARVSRGETVNVQQGTGRGEPVIVHVVAGEMFDARVVQGAAQVVRAAAPGMLNTASAKTRRDAARPITPGGRTG